MKARRSWQWDEFRETARRFFTDQLHVTLDRKGRFSIDLKTWNKMKRPEAVVLLYDRDAQTIGIRPSSIEVPHAVMVRPRHERHSKAVTSRRFFSKHRIVIEKTLEFPTAAIDDEGVLVLNLREMI